jgi:exodeoxyribonuclease X
MKIFRVHDYETTGFPPSAGIVELAWTDLVWEGKAMNVGETYSELLNPGVPIQIGAKAVHHITEKMLEGKRHPTQVLSSLQQGVDFLVAHNLKFEDAFHQRTIPGICTLKCARELIPEAPGHKLQELRYYLEEHLDLDPTRCDPPHRAGPDTYVTAHLLKHLFMLSAKMGGDFVGRLVQISSGVQLPTVIRFGKYKGQTFQQLAIEDPKYLRWIIGNPQAEPEVVLAAKKALG